METWVTIYTTVIHHKGVYGYSYYYNHDSDNKSYTGVFGGSIVDRTHAEICAVGAALKAVKTALKDHTIKGITIYTDNNNAIKIITQYVDSGKITVNDSNGAYVVGLNRLLGSLRTRRIYAKKQRYNAADWLVTAIYRKILKILELRQKRSKFSS